MLAILRNIAARTARALEWLGSQGTRAIAALVFIGIALPPLGELLKPYVTEAIFALLCLSFLRVDLSALRDYLRRPGLVLAATAWTMVGVPLLAGEIGVVSPPLDAIARSISCTDAAGCRITDDGLTGARGCDGS